MATLKAGLFLRPAVSVLHCRFQEREKEGGEHGGSPAQPHGPRLDRSSAARGLGGSRGSRPSRPAPLGSPPPRYLHRLALGVGRGAPNGGVEGPQRVPCAARESRTQTAPQRPRYHRRLRAPVEEPVGAYRPRGPRGPRGGGGGDSTRRDASPALAARGDWDGVSGYRRPLPAGPRARGDAGPGPALPLPPAQRISPQQRLHLRAGVGLGRRRLLGLLHEPVLVVLVDVEAAEARGEGAARHAGTGTHRNRKHPPRPTGTGIRRHSPAPGSRGRGGRAFRSPREGEHTNTIPPPSEGAHVRYDFIKNTKYLKKNQNNHFNVQIQSL